MTFLANAKKLSVKRNEQRKKVKKKLKPKITSCSILRQLYVKFFIPSLSLIHFSPRLRLRYNAVNKLWCRCIFSLF